MSSTISVPAELERLGYKYEYSGEEHIKCNCPFHDDTSPSCSINLKTQLFLCQTAGCGAKGDFLTFLARALNTTRAAVFAELSTRYTFDSSKIINTETVERYYDSLPNAKLLLKELSARGVDKLLIEQYRLGECRGRITIPIKNEGGMYVNIRRYLPGSPSKDKMRNTRGHGSIRLYPIIQLSYDEIVLCGGEIKAIVAAKELNKFNIGAITATAGEGNWTAELSKKFQGKKVYVLLDVDSQGQEAAKERCQHLSRVCRWVGNILLPLDIDKYPNGDINDYVVAGHKLKPLLDKAEKWIYESTLKTLEDTKPEKVDLVQAAKAKYTGKRVKIKACISAMDTAPYIIPKDVEVQCKKDQKYCIICPAFGEDDMKASLHVEAAAILEMVSASRSVQREALMRGLGIPANCKVVEIVPITYYNAEDTRISPQLEITNRSADQVMQPAVCIGEGLELNESYNLIGRMYPHPKTQQSTLLISEYEPTTDALSTYKCADLEELKLFQPKEWTVKSIQEKFDNIYSDFEANVTRIYQRRGLHLAIDLAYHSPLFIKFDGRTVKGWVEILVLGDSSQGKSDTAINMMNHYALGAKVECKNASVAGLLGGLQQFGNRWFVTWGIMPTHDKRLVIWEELKGASTEVIAKMTDMRSSGVAEIPKIERRRTHARTRLVALSNPRSNQQLSSYNFGIEAIQELVGGLEDVRRFDYCVLLSANDIASDALNKLLSNRPQVPHRFSSDLTRKLILWAWTRRQEQVTFSEEACNQVLKCSTKLCDTFTEAIPLVDRGSMRYKIARLAASLACRTFSCSEDFESVVIRPAHVEFVAKLYKDTYSTPVFGYVDFTEAIKITTTLVDPLVIKKQIESTPFPGDFIKNFLHTDKIDMQDIQDWCAWDRSEAQQMLSFLVRKHAIIRCYRYYRKNPTFIHLLKEMLNSREFVNRPDFIKEEF